MKQKHNDWERREADAQAKHLRPPRSFIDELWHHEQTVRGTLYPPLMRRTLEGLTAGAPERFDWENYHDLKGLIDAFEKDERAAWDEYALTQALQPRAEGLPEEVKSRGCVTRGPNTKCRRRRLRLLTFVADRYLTAENFLERHLRFGRRIQWKKEIEPQWNAMYEQDRRTDTDLRVRYYEARREEYLRELYFDRLYQQMVEPILQPLAAGIVALAHELRSGTPERKQDMRRIARERPSVWPDFVELLITEHSDYVGARLQEAGIVSSWPRRDPHYRGPAGAVWRRALKQPLDEKLRALREDIAEVERFARGMRWVAPLVAGGASAVSDVPELSDTRRRQR